MLTLLTFPASFDQPSHSPYCVKAMCLLQMSGQSWQPEFLDNPTRMPLGKLPVLRDGKSLIPDSANIQAHLEAAGADFYPGLSKAQRAQAHAMMHMAEDSLYLHLVYNRWLEPENWSVVRDVFFAAIPRLIRKPITGRIRKQVVAGLTSHGIARFSEVDRLARLSRDLNALSAQLAGKPFLFGAAPCAADASVAPVIGMLAELPADTATRNTVRARTDLIAYAERCRAAIYPQDTPALSVAA